MRERLARFHQRLALIVLNFLLLFLFLNALVLIYDAWKPPGPRPAASPQQKVILPVYQLGPLKYGLDRLRQVYPGMPDEQLIRLELENWNVQLVCDPRTLYTEEPFEGHYVRVDQAGFRRIADQGPWPPNRHAFNIFVFGGSTTFGYGVDDAQTIPSVLQKRVRQALGRPDMFVYNFGHSFFFSLQERIAFEAMLHDGTVPNLAVFVDGLNEFHHWNGTPTMRPCKEDGTFRQRLRRTVLCRPDELCWPLQALAFRMGTVRPSEESPGRFVGPFVEPPPPDDPATNRAVVERWIANARGIEESAARHQTRVLFIRQPVPTYAYDTAYHLFADDLELYARPHWGYPVWEQMMKEDRDGRWTADLLDLARLGEGRRAPLYVDAVHYTPAFMDEIATAIAQALITRRLLPAPAGPRPP